MTSENPPSPVYEVERFEDAPAGFVVFRNRRDGLMVAVLPGSRELDRMHTEHLDGEPEWTQVDR